VMAVKRVRGVRLLGLSRGAKAMKPTAPAVAAQRRADPGP